jgi:hypothetical protein
MKPDAVSADRMESIREAGREWFQAGWIDGNACQKIEAMYPDDRVRVGPGFRILFFILTFAAILGVVLAICVLLDDETPISIFAIIAGIACWMTADYLIGTKKRRQGGIEAAFSLAALVSLMAGLSILITESNGLREQTTYILLLFIFFLLAGAAGWNWGYWPYMAISAALLFLAIMPLPFGRLFWVVTTIVLYPLLTKGCDSGRIPPALRKSSAAFLAVHILVLYAAVHIYMLDHHVSFSPYEYRYGFEYFPRWLSVALTATIPVLVLLTGIVRRRRLFLVLGFVLALFSFATLRMYVHLAPLWILLTGAGVLLLVAAGLLRRFLDSGVEKERAGFTTALQATQDKHSSVEILASVAALTPDASASVDNPQFRGGGGEFGGGGASGKF